MAIKCFLVCDTMCGAQGPLRPSEEQARKAAEKKGWGRVVADNGQRSDVDRDLCPQCFQQHLKTLRGMEDAEADGQIPLPLS